MTNEDLLSSAYGVANSILQLEQRITQDALEKTIDTITAMPQFATVDGHRLLRELEANNNIHVPGYSVIDDSDFRAWVSAEQESTSFEFWNRYRNFLDKKKRFPQDVLEQLDRLTSDILDRLRDPKTAGAWDRRGLVVGDVQSGKTANYIGLICKAVDAGFPLVVVLAGLHNSLRSQTQLRIDEGFLGFDTRLSLLAEQENQRIGAGKMPSAPFLIAHSLTSSTEGGDFKRAIAHGTKIIPGGNDPVILVVKKRVSILRNLIDWVLSVRGVSDPSVPGGRIIRDVPVLVIDDEADNASANTNEYFFDDGTIDEDADPTRTNGLIRKLLTSFEKAAYVGYTATPFANVFMHHEATSNTVGEDLFPRSFIINIPAPTNYIGPEQVFGVVRPNGNEDRAGLPIIRHVLDADHCFPARHRKDLLVSGLPISLREAILAFILACSARRARGEIEAHNSMLIHVTRFTLVQDQVARLVDEEMVDIRRQLEFPGTGGEAEERLRHLWITDFQESMPRVCALLPDHDLPTVDWNTVKKQLFDAVKRISVRRINGSAKDALNYAENPLGLSVIAIGGDKLSRGLTLEGLSISYFLRPSRMYDTLMQMGRWFGYRPRYADLCRLYTPPDLIDWYRHIATATAELREEFDLMFLNGENPLQFGNRVRSHPNGLLITATNKMRSGISVRAGFSGTISETVSFDIPNAQHNLNAFIEFLENLPLIAGTTRYVWRNVDGNRVAELMRRLETSRASWKANSKAISDYIFDRMSSGKLRDWTIVLVANGRTQKSAQIGPYSVVLTERSNQIPGSSEKMSIRRLVSPTDEMIDLNESEKGRALKQTIEAWGKKTPPKGDQPTSASGPFIRKQRSPENGLLLIYPILGPDPKIPIMGFAVSFPFDHDAPVIDYTENSVRQLVDLFA